MPRVSDEAVIVGVNFQAIVGTPMAVISRIHRLALPPGKLGKWAAIITVAVISRIHRLVLPPQELGKWAAIIAVVVISRIHRLAFPPRELGRYRMIMVRIDELKNFCN